MHTNPAMTGTHYKHLATMQWRNQWTKMNGAPTTLWASYAAKIDKINSGIGGSYEYDVIGFNKSHTALVSYAYHLPIKNMFLSFGASGGIKTLHFDANKVVTQVPDPFFQSRTYKPVFQCDFGIALHQEHWNVGLSSTQLNAATFRTDSLYEFKNSRHYWLFFDYTFKLNENWKLTPRFQVMTEMIKLGGTIALTASWKDLWFGASTSANFTNNPSVAFLVGYDIVSKFRVGYAYEQWLSQKFQGIMGGSHEIVLSVQLK